MNFKQISTIQIPQIKGLKGFELKELKKLNVLCGKNNSGKTTILEGINNIGQRTTSESFNENNGVGIKLTKEHIQKFINASNFGSNKVRVENSLYYFQESFLDEIFFSNNFNGFWNKLYNFVRDNAHIVLDNLQQSYSNIFRQFFYFKIVYIPAKRNPATSGPIDTIQQLYTENTGLINYLFTCKNSDYETEKHSFYTKLQMLLEELSSGFSFDVVIQQDNPNAINNHIALKFSNDGINWRKAPDCGLGLRDLLLILAYSIISDANVLLIEEPENHMNPEMQRKLLNFLKEGTNKQYFLSTHSNVFLDDSYVDKVFYTHMENSEVKVDDATSKANMLNDLGYSISDNLVSDLIILTEGPKDRLVVEEFLKKMDLIPKYNIKFWPMGGDIMGQLDLSVFIDSYKVIALIDNDPGSNHNRKKLIAKCEELKIHCHRLQRYSIENYFTLESLKKVFSTQIPETVTEIKTDIKLEDQIGMDVKKSNRKIAQNMELSDIENTDLNEFLKKVKDMLR